MKLKKEKPAKLDSKDYLKLGEMLANLVEYNYVNKRSLFLMSFVKGVVTGFGGVIGATIVVGLLVWFLSWFDSFPIIKDFTETIQNSTQSK